MELDLANMCKQHNTALISLILTTKAPRIYYSILFGLEDAPFGLPRLNFLLSHPWQLLAVHAFAMRSRRGSYRLSFPRCNQQSSSCYPIFYHDVKGGTVPLL